MIYEDIGKNLVISSVIVTHCFVETLMCRSAENLQLIFEFDYHWILHCMDYSCIFGVLDIVG